MTTTTAPTTAPPSTASRRAGLAFVGAALWTLSSVVWGISDLGSQEFGSIRFVAVAVAWCAFMVLPPVLLVFGHAGLRAALGPTLGRTGRVGIVLAASGLGAMGLGIGIEVASMSLGGGEVDLGHLILLAGWLVGVVGAFVTGVTVIRRRRDGVSRAAGWLLVLAVPLGIGIGVLGGVVAPETDAFFWAALTVPTGLAWLLLGRSLAVEHRPTARGSLPA
jgi:hypothetical protein